MFFLTISVDNLIINSNIHTKLQHVRHCSKIDTRVNNNKVVNRLMKFCLYIIYELISEIWLSKFKIIVLVDSTYLKKLSLRGKFSMDVLICIIKIIPI